MKIAYAQMKIAAGHPDINTEKMLSFIKAAQTQGAAIVIFPEFAISGKLLGNTWLEESFLRECEACGKKIIAASKNITVAFGNIVVDWKEKHAGEYLVHQSIFFAQDEKILTRVNGAGEFEIRLDNKTYWLGYACGNESFQYLADLRIRFSSEPFTFNKNIYAEKFPTQCPLIKVSAVGIQNTGKVIYTFPGGSAVLNSRNKLVQGIAPFEEWINFIDFEEIDDMTEAPLPKELAVEKIYRALHYGAKTFLEQIDMKKVIIGVSGGIDSAVAAALYTQVIGAKNVITVNMPSVFNSATTKGLSEQLAKNLGCKYYTVPIQESVDWTVNQLEERGIKISNFVKENIQARDRSSRILAALAASLNGGFTCNANKAETTVGYATLYGDEAGFLSVLADLWKYQIYDLARYMNKEIYKREVIPQGIIDIVPSAELSTAQNVDEGKGDPLFYPYHDYLFRAFVEENLTPEELLQTYASGNIENKIGCEKGLVQKYFPTTKEFIEDLERWWKQFKGIGIAKRIQSPPILAITNKPYGARNESQNGWHLTKVYLELKDKLLAQQPS